ncbi:AsmA family protein [Dechloromonas sp. A34]|uniref:AsmA family protein n=1 Tax=Dechloromonas sp. A34 TaxID=447588 RepID=UPI0022495F87|nr:AsmA family protein [Dechloromonas sp. A34]
MTVVRKLGIGVAVLVGLLVGAAGVLYALFDEAAIKRQLVEQVAAKTGRQLTIGGELGLSVWPDVAVRVGQVGLSEADGRSEFLNLASARIAVAVMPLLSKRLEAKRIEIDGLTVNLVKHKDGSLNIDDLTRGKPAPDAAPEAAPGQPGEPLEIDVAGLELRNVRVNWRDEASGKTSEISDLDLATGALSGNTGSKRFSVEKLKLATQGSVGADHFVLALETPGVVLTAGEAKGETLTFMATLESAGKKVVAKIALQDLAGSLDALTIRNLVFGLDGKVGEAEFKADLSSPVSVNGKDKIIRLDRLAGSLAVSSPALPVKQVKLPMDGRLTADIGRQRADIVLKTHLDDSQMDLKLLVERFSPLALDFTIGIDQLNVDRYLPPKKAGPGGGEKANVSAKAETGGAEAKIDLSALKGLDLKGAIKIGRLQAHKLKLSGLDVQIEAAGGRLQVAPLRASLYGGSLDGALAVNAASNQFSLRQNLRGVDISPLLKDLADKDFLEGHGNVSLDVTTRGDTVSALKRGLAGKAALDLRDGAIKGINVAKLLRSTKNLLGGKQAVSGTADTAEKTEFSGMTASFNIDGGVARNNDLSLKSPVVRLAGGGEIDIGHDRIDYLAKVSVDDSMTGPGSELAQLKGISVPLRLRGPYSQIAYTLELDKLLVEVAKSQLKEKATEALGKELQKLFGK